MSRKFNQYDLLKCMATFFVVIGHITILYNADKHPEINTAFLEKITFAIYLFHMPLFMAVSGSVYEIGFKKGKYQDFVPFIKNKVYRLLIPYMYVGLFFLLPTLVAINSDLSFSQPALYNKILLAQDNRHLWFLLALFWIFIFQFVADKLRIPRWVQFCISFVFAILLPFRWGNFMCISQALHYWPYFMLGILIESNIKIKSLKIGAILSIIGIMIVGGVDWTVDSLWVDIILHILLPCFIIVLFNIAGKWTMNHIRASKWFTAFLDYSFSIYLFHVSVIFIMHYYLRTMSAYILIPLMFVAGILGPIGIAIIIRKLRLQFMIGEKYEKQM